MNGHVHSGEGDDANPPAGCLPLPPLASDWSSGSVNLLTGRLQRRRVEGRTTVDLVLANPHENGLVFPHETLQEALRRGVEHARVYRPDALGQRAARMAIAGYYERRGMPTKPEQVVLTPGTSLAYLYAFRLLCQPGEEILVPRPGYPLFDDLARLAGVTHRYYHYGQRVPGQAWRPDLDDLEFQVTERTRVVAVVSPHNPLGSVFSTEELERLATLCRRRHLALLFDEVFCEARPATEQPFPRPPADMFELVVVLNGFSKMLSLPGYKLGWMRVDGASPRVPDFLGALEYASDLLLPVAEAIQAAVPELLEAGERHVVPRLRQLHDERRAVIARHLGDYLVPSEGGIYACLRLGRPGAGSPVDDDQAALDILEDLDVLVHPGHFYDLPGHLVMTSVPRPEILEEACPRLAAWLDRRKNGD